VRFIVMRDCVLVPLVPGSAMLGLQEAVVAVVERAAKEYAAPQPGYNDQSGVLVCLRVRTSHPRMQATAAPLMIVPLSFFLWGNDPRIIGTSLPFSPMIVDSGGSTFFAKLQDVGLRGFPCAILKGAEYNPVRHSQKSASIYVACIQHLFSSSLFFVSILYHS
jgi:hypothetical protein